MATPVTRTTDDTPAPVEAVGEPGEPASLVARLAMRLRRSRSRIASGLEGGMRQPTDDLLAFSRQQIVSQCPVAGVDLADPLSISTDATTGTVRVEFTRLDDLPASAEPILDEVIARIGPPLFADGRIGCIEVGLVSARATRGASDSAGIATSWAIVRLGHQHEHAC